MPQKITKQKLLLLSDEENDKIRTLAESKGYKPIHINSIFKAVEKRNPSFLDMQRFINWGFSMIKINSILKLSDSLGIITLKETNSFIKLGRGLRPKKIKDRISQYTGAVTSYGRHLEEVKKREWNPQTKSIEIKLEGGKTRTMPFKNEGKFNEHKQADIDTLSKHIEHDKGKIEDWQTIKKFKETI